MDMRSRKEKEGKELKLSRKEMSWSEEMNEVFYAVK